MRHERDVLRRSMDLEPEQWLDRLVADRVRVEVRQRGAAQASTARLVAIVQVARATLARARFAVWLRKLLLPSVLSWPRRGSDQRG